jgi:hypothetical protein
MIRERLPTLAAVTDMVDYLFVEDLRVDPGLLVPKRWDAAATSGALTAAREVIASLGPVSFEADELEPPLRKLADERGWKVGDLFMAIRVAVTGRTATPPLFDVLVALGYERTLVRLDAAARGARRGHRGVSSVRPSSRRHARQERNGIASSCVRQRAWRRLFVGGRHRAVAIAATSSVASTFPIALTCISGRSSRRVLARSRPCRFLRA